MFVKSSKPFKGQLLLLGVKSGEEHLDKFGGSVCDVRGVGWSVRECGSWRPDWSKSVASTTEMEARPRVAPETNVI